MKDFRLVLFAICFLKSNVSAFFNCPLEETHFQKVLGYYPLTSSSTINWDHLRFYPSPLACLKFCQEDPDCSGFIFNVKEQKCLGVNLEISLNEALDSRKLVHDPGVIYFEKSCLKLPGECRTIANKAWPILRIPATALIGAGFKHIDRLVTRRQCSELCLAEREFLCRSASFRRTLRNNYNRERERELVLDWAENPPSPQAQDGEKALGECVLSRDDKNSKPDAFRVSNDEGEEYIENQCVPQDFVQNQCSYERYLNASFLYSDDLITGLSEQECQGACDSESRFKCLGLTYVQTGSIPTGNGLSTCALHSDDIISLGPRAVRGGGSSSAPGSVYMRRVQCLNVSVICDPDTMIVRYIPEQYFVGKMYVNAASRKNCSTQSTTDLGLLRIPLGNETRENSCGIVHAYQLAPVGGGGHNRTLITATIVIQNHPSVQSQGDRLIKVGCILNGSGRGTGADRQSKLLEVGDVGGESAVLQVAGLDVPTVPGPKALRPTVKLVDLDNNIESKVVEVGQSLQLRVFYPEDYGYDLEVTNLKATSPTTGQELYLLDYKGCPIDESIFPEMILADIDGTLTLVSQFVAFKFAESALVDLSMTVRSCYKSCPLRTCRRRGRGKRQEPIKPIVFPTNDWQPMPPSANPPLAPSYTTTLGPVRFPAAGPITFPKYTVERQEVDVRAGERPEDSINNNSIENVVYQRVISSFDEPFEDKIKKLGDTSNVEIKELFKNYSKMIEYPITLRIRVFSTSDTITPESLIYGENRYPSESSSESDEGDQTDQTTRRTKTTTTAICVDQTFILCLLLFFGILVIVLVIGCSLMLYRYKRRLQKEEDRNSLHHRFNFGFEPSLSYDVDSLSRRVHWADGFATARSAYP